MFKTIRRLTFTILLGLFMALPVLSETDLLFSTLSVTVEKGETFNVVISIDPKEVKNYTAKLELDYPADLLEVTFFYSDPAWLVVNQPGYDVIDNAEGLIIKTAGYPGGVLGETIFGTISFLAKKTGSGVITVRDSSFVLEATNQNVLSDALPQIPVTIFSVTAPISPIEPFETPQEFPEDIDSDDDGMPDGWETRNDLDVSNSNDMCQDSDGDGLVNLEEYIFDTDPQDKDTHNTGTIDGRKMWTMNLGDIDRLSAAVPLDLSLPGRINFSLQGKEYIITVWRANEDALLVLALPACVRDTITYPKAADLDINQDGEVDLTLSLESMGENKAIINFDLFTPTLFDIAIKPQLEKLSQQRVILPVAIAGGVLLSLLFIIFREKILRLFLRLYKKWNK